MGMPDQTLVGWLLPARGTHRQIPVHDAGGGGSDRVLIKFFPGLVMHVRARSLTKMYPRHAFVRLILQVFAEFMSEWHMV